MSEEDELSSQLGRIRRSENEASLERIEKKGRQFLIVSGKHNSKQAEAYFREDIANEITVPEDWYFLIENVGSETIEIAAAEELARQKGIIVDDPIFPPYNKHTVELFSQSHPNSRELIFGDLVLPFMLIKGEPFLRSFADSGIATIEELRSGFALAAIEKLQDSRKYDRDKKRRYEELIKTSNILSAQVSDYLLRQHPDKKFVAIYLGVAHREAIEMDLEQIPHILKLTDTEIKSLVEERKKQDPRKI